MPIYFDELESILNQWKIYSFTWKGDKNNELELKQRMIAKIVKLLELINHTNINVVEEVYPSRTYGKINYNNVVRVSLPNSKL